jgi:transposase
VHDRHDLTDQEWALLEPLLPDQRRRRARPWKDHRQVVNGVLWRTRTGSPWRDLPASYGCWKTVYNRHRRWSADGTWARVLQELQRGCDLGEERWVVAIDSTVVRAHHHAAGARLEPPGDVPAAVLASALAEDLAEAAAADSGAVAAPEGLTGGWIESHESAAWAGQTA